VHLVFGQDELVANWVGINLGLTIHKPYTAIGGTTDGQSLAIGAVFNQWNGSNIEITLYGPGALRRGAIRGIYHYVFVQLGAQRLSATTRRSNKLMCRKLSKLGFECEGVGKRFFGSTRKDDAVRFVLFPHAAERWMK
jgi:hypothetical protein